MKPKATIATMVGLATACAAVVFAVVAASPGNVKKIEVSLAPMGGACKADIERHKRVKKSDNDFLTFRFASECAAQWVHVCAFEKATGNPATPWHECAGLPLADPAKLGTKFKMAAGSSASPATAHAVCTIAFPAAASFPRQEYRLCVANADATGADPVCNLSKCDPKRGELALEVDP